LRGRKPKPTALRLIEGKRGHRPLPKDEPTPTGKAEKPAWMADFPPVSRVWDEMAPIIEGMGLLTDADTKKFARYCTLMAEFQKDPDGFPTSKHAVLSTIEAEFGMSPSARARLGTHGKKKTGNAFAEIA
jgi:phage terminase small subunit